MREVLLESISAGLLAAVLAAVAMPLRWGMMEGMLGWWILSVGLGTAAFTAAYGTIAIELSRKKKFSKEVL
ncbi:MAG: hypothetical protein Q7K28_03450 [Candidatus Wildermuthbacteria bacterium]|nr:hypothetical protein [Candidatus Wildermuthbacteria bacterium]